MQYAHNDLAKPSKIFWSRISGLYILQKRKKEKNQCSSLWTFLDPRCAQVGNLSLAQVEGGIAIVTWPTYSFLVDKTGFLST